MIHKQCPRCGRKGNRDGFRVRGQFCVCGWTRDVRVTEALREGAAPKPVARTSDGCEWSPDFGRAAYEHEEHYRTTPAAVLVGADGQWRLCDSCAALPHFGRFKTRRAIRLEGANG